MVGQVLTPTGQLIIRPSTAADAPGIWSLLEPCFRAGETYAIRRDITRLMLEHSLVRAKARGFVDAFVMHKSLGADEDERSPGRGVGVGQG